MLWLFLKGIVVGFCVAAPVGPIALLCVRRSVTEGRVSGLVTGLGAATADLACGVVAALGISAVSAFMVEQREWLQLLGGLFMVGFGIMFIRAKPPAAREAGAAPVHVSLPTAYFTTLALTLSNPMTIIGFAGAFAGAGFATDTATPLTATLIVAGVFLGSTAWWVILSTSASYFGRYLQAGGMRVVNVTSGAVILVFGLWQLVAAARHAWR